MGFIEDDELTVDAYQPLRCPDCTVITVVRRDSSVDSLAGVLRMHREHGCLTRSGSKR